MGYQVPAAYARKEYRPEILTETITISNQTIFWAEAAYWSLYEFYCVRAIDVQTGQLYALKQGARGEFAAKRLLPEEIPAIEIVNAEIARTITIGKRTIEITVY